MTKKQNDQTIASEPVKTAKYITFRPKAEPASEETLRSSDWVEALERAYDALEAVMEHENGQRNLELSSVLIGTASILRSEIMNAHASTDQAERP